MKVMLRPRIFDLNGLKVADVPQKRHAEVLEGLLQESENFWGHARMQQLHAKVPELNRHFYRSWVESRDSTSQAESSNFELSANFSQNQLKALQNKQVEVKLENPKKLELQNEARISNAALKKLEAKQSELSSFLFAIENVAELKPKIPEVKEAIKNLGDFISTLRKMTVLLDINQKSALARLTMSSSSTGTRMSIWRVCEA